ncbi:MAG TPA: hypothetical protein VF627_09825 [Abditibacterium sp.]|jgi:hypothetical protein
MNLFLGRKLSLLGVTTLGIGALLLIGTRASQGQIDGGSQVFQPNPMRRRILIPGANQPNRPALPAGSLEKANTPGLPLLSKRLILSAEASSQIRTVTWPKKNSQDNVDGEIYLCISFEDGTPFYLAKAGDIRIEPLGEAQPERAKISTATLDRASSRPDEGVWRVALSQINEGSHFYRINVKTDVPGQRTTYQGQTIVRANYTVVPYWIPSRPDGTIWIPPK